MLKLLSLCILLFFSCTTLPPTTQTLSPEPNIPEVSNPNHSNLTFTELWGYVLAGKEHCLKPEYPLTDIAYFGANLSTFGELVDVPNPTKLQQFNARKHMVIVDSSRSLSHFCIDPNFPLREKLIQDIVLASAHFDGIQIDFELVPRQDKDSFISFLKELKEHLPIKIISVALPARLKDIENDQYDYYTIAQIVDKIVVMAYDEHWSTSKPGPIASMDWCQKIALYAKEKIPQEKLIMGLPFYGRAWSQDKTPGAYRYEYIEHLKEKHAIATVNRKESIPYFEIPIETTIHIYYEDTISLRNRLSLYTELAIENVSFWRLGLEDISIWNHLSIKKDLSQ